MTQSADLHPPLPTHAAAASAAIAHALPARTPARIGVVSFLNTLPLIDGLEKLDTLQLVPSVPSDLLSMLERRDVLAALCSSIDYQRSSSDLRILPCGMLGCDGPTLTVRLYSAVPLNQVREVHCDTDSHTSVILMRILLKELFGVHPLVTPYNARDHVAYARLVDWPQTVLLIGDKVVTDQRPAVRYPHQLDLGAAWNELSGLPFVFALWLAHAADCDIICQSGTDHPVRRASIALDRQRRANALRIDRIVHASAEKKGWPADLAREYLGQRLRFNLDDRAIAGLNAFFLKAHAHGFISALKPLHLLEL